MHVTEEKFSIVLFGQKSKHNKHKNNKMQKAKTKQSSNFIFFSVKY